MKVGDLVKHTPTGDFVIVLELSEGGGGALIYFTTGQIVGYAQWYSTSYLEVINENR